MVVNKTDQSTFEATVKAISSGGITILPCDTIYGICGVAPTTEDRIRDLKERDEKKPFILLISSLSMLRTVAEEPVDRRLQSFWPGPLTLVVRNRAGGTVAVRIPADDFVRRVIDRCGPIYSSSVNVTGSPSLNTIDEIVTQFEARVDLIVDGGDFIGHLASTVVDSTTSPYRLIRPGACLLPESLFTIDTD